MILHVSILEYNVVEHCNLACVNCDHSSPLLPKRIPSIETVVGDLAALARVLHADEIKILGGEPLLRKDLPALLAEVRLCGVADRITVVTNGTLLHRAAPEFWKGIDTLRLSIYPGITPALSPEAVERICAERGIVFIPQRMDRFRETVLDFRIEDSALVEAIRRNCEMPVVNHCHTVRNGRYYKCSPAAFAQTRLALLGVEQDDGANAVTIGDNRHLAEELEAYLASDAVLPACAFCLGTSGVWSEHRQLPRPHPMPKTAPALPWDLLDPRLGLEWKMEKTI